MVKTSGAQRESDGVIVLVTMGRNPVVGKDPDFGHVDREGKRKGMAGETIRSNYPVGVYAP
jgi:RNA-directed DNA polymerase